MVAGTIGVVGAGTMGSQIAAQCALSGYEVVLVDADAGMLENAAANNERHLNRRVEKGTMLAHEASSALGRITSTTMAASLDDAEIVIEAVFEDAQVKRDLFATMDTICRSDAILASNSSTFPVAEIANSVSHPERLVNLHFFHPVLVMKLVEIMRSAETSDATVAHCEAFVTSIGRESVVIEKPLSNLIVNRVLAAIKREALWLASEGYASPADIDRAVKLGLNHPMGPFELTDFSGLDVFYAIMQQRFTESGDESWRPPEMLRLKVEAGELGRKTGKGFYEY